MHVAAGLRKAGATPRPAGRSRRGRFAARESHADAGGLHGDVLSLQRQVGNQAVSRLLQRAPDPDADYKAAARVMARLGAGKEAELVDWYRMVGDAMKSSGSAVLKAAKHLASMVGKNGAQLFKDLLHVPQKELEIYWTLASSLTGSHKPLANAVMLVRGLRDPGAGLESALEAVGPDLKAFLENVPPDELRKGLTGLSLFRIYKVFELAKGLKVREQIAFALFDTILQASQGEYEQFAREISDEERWALQGYLYSDFSTKFLKGREVRNRLSQPFTLTIGGHGEPSHRL